MKYMKYKVLKAFGEYKVNDVLDAKKEKHRKIIKRKIEEKWTIEPIKKLLEEEKGGKK